MAFEAGKAIIQSATKPVNYGGHDYYWDNHYQAKPNEIVCSMPLSQLQQLTPSTTTTTTSSTTAAPVAAGDASTSTTTAAPPSPEQVLNTLQFQDGTRPKQITWGCKRGLEVCCGTDCCPAPANNVNANVNANGNNAGSGAGGGGASQNMAGVAIGLALLLLL